MDQLHPLAKLKFALAANAIHMPWSKAPNYIEALSARASELPTNASHFLQQLTSQRAYRSRSTSYTLNNRSSSLIQSFPPVRHWHGIWWDYLQFGNTISRVYCNNILRDVIPRCNASIASPTALLPYIPSTQSVSKAPIHVPSDKVA